VQVEFVIIITITLLYFYHLIFNKNITMVATSGSATAYPSRSPGFSEVAQPSVFSIVFFRPLYYLFVSNLPHLFIHL